MTYSADYRNTKYKAKIPYKEWRAGRLLPYFEEFIKSPDSPDKVANELLKNLIYSKGINELIYPSKIGWIIGKDSLKFYSSNGFMECEYHSMIPKRILNHRLKVSKRAALEIWNDFVKIAGEGELNIMLTVFRTASLLTKLLIGLNGSESLSLKKFHLKLQSMQLPFSKPSIDRQLR